MLHSFLKFNMILGGCIAVLCLFGAYDTRNIAWLFFIHEHPQESFFVIFEYFQTLKQDLLLQYFENKYSVIVV